jgi:ankyrin repeat protein
MHCCLRGYTSGSAEASAKLSRTKKDRLACVQILLKYDGMTKVNLNFQNDVVKMTALHWAAYNDDLEVVRTLIEAGA